MKKTVKAAKRPNSPRKTPKNTGKRRYTPAKRPKKRAKKGGAGVTAGSYAGISDALRAFLLVAALIVCSVVISFAVITVRSSLKKTPGIIPEIEPPVEKVSVTAEPVSVTEPPVEKVNTPPARPAVEPSKPAVAVQPPAKPSSSQNSGSTSRNVPANTGGSTARNVSTNTGAASNTQRPVTTLGTLVFVIDDAGNNLRELEPFLSLPFPLTIAVLPGLPHSAEAARMIRAAGKEVFLHQPMEALGAQNPGPGAIYLGMSADEIRAVLKRNIVEVGPVAGMNNHQGSKITTDSEAMKTILAFCAEQGLVFLDSRTTADTVVPAEANRLGMKIGERDVFLDNEQDRDSMLEYLTGGLGKARQNGRAVMIGHTWSPQLALLLAEQFPQLERRGYSLSTASAIIKSK